VAQSGVAAEQGPNSLPQVHRRGDWRVAETANFWVCCYSEQLPAAEIATHCETLHQQLYEKWFAEKNPHGWSTKCMVVLHPNQESYLAVVGQGAAATAGASVVERIANCKNSAANCIGRRRIDLRGDRADYLTAALPHELTHVILADHFSEDSLPRWADEGMAVLADTQAKRDLHARDLRGAWARGTTFRVADLLPLKDYPATDRFAVFYGQSLSIVDFLVSRDSPHQFVKFLDMAKLNGYDQALRDCYRIGDISELERLWAASLADTPAVVAKNR
jgi:hypothetical protein